VTHDVPEPQLDVTLYLPSQSSVVPETMIPVISHAKPGQGDVVHVSHETVEQLAETENSDRPDESWMSIEGPSPHIEVMQYEPTVENVIDALPGEVNCRLASVPSLLQPRVASGIKISASTSIAMIRGSRTSIAHESSKVDARLNFRGVSDAFGTLAADSCAMWGAFDLLRRRAQLPGKRRLEIGALPRGRRVDWSPQNGGHSLVQASTPKRANTASVEQVGHSRGDLARYPFTNPAVAAR
jgi:hypothetical protein